MGCCVRHITQDDAHIFCTEEQVPDEIQRCLDSGFAIYDTFGFEPRLELSTRPETRVGSEDMWDRAEAALEKALVDKGLEFELNPGDGAFYGPKIDLHMTDSIGRSWQLGTVQLDYYMRDRFELTYTGADDAEHRPVMIHRALMGSFERFMGILIEHYAGEFPLWLSPVQAAVLPLADRHVDYAREVHDARRGRPAPRLGGRRAELEVVGGAPAQPGARGAHAFVISRSSPSLISRARTSLAIRSRCASRSSSRRGSVTTMRSVSSSPAVLRMALSA
jgi:threonyl-tRNA synthetase